MMYYIVCVLYGIYINIVYSIISIYGMVMVYDDIRENHAAI